MIILIFNNSIIFIPLGPSAACAPLGITDLSSSRTLKENGWELDIKQMEDRLTFTKSGCYNLLHTINENKWVVQKWSATEISTDFWDHGKATLLFGNCNNQGHVTVLLDGTEIGKSDLNVMRTNVTFNFAEGSKLTIQTDDRSIIQLFDMKLECGKRNNSKVDYFMIVL